MSANGLEVFDRTINMTNTWLTEIMGDTGLGRAAAWHALGAVLRTLRDRLQPSLAAHLAGQLPLLIRGTYYEGWQPEQAPDRYRHPSDFIEHIKAELGPQSGLEIERVLPAVMAVLEDHIDKGQMRKVEEALPREVRTLWQTG